MKFGINTIDDFKIEKKLVLCRVDINSPLNESKDGFTDTTRMERCVPTIKELSDRKARLVLMAHQGSDVEYHNYYNTKLHAAVLSEMVGKKIKYINDVCGPAAQNKIRELNPGEILLVDNVRFMAEEMTLFETKLNLSPVQQAETQIVKRLSPLADLYVCDAFAAAHRSQPTLIGFEEVLPSAMGRLLEKEVTSLNKLLDNPQQPCIFILGGAKIHDAFRMLTSVLKNNIADTVIATGLLANILLVARGETLGQASVQVIKDNNLWEFVDKGKEILKEYSNKINLPVDLACSLQGVRKEVGVSDLPVKYPLADIGSKSIEKIKQKIETAQTIFFNGPPGVFEKEETESGTKSILLSIAESDAFSVIGGGDTIAAINKYSSPDRYSYISTGGGALIRFLSGEKLPVIKALEKSTAKYGNTTKKVI